MIYDTLAYYSDLTFNSAAAIYLFAMVLFAAEQAFGTRRQVTDAVAEPRLAHAGVAGAGSGNGAGSAGGAGPAGGTGRGDSAMRPGKVTPPARPGLPVRLGRMAVALTVLAVVLHAASIVLRGLASQRVPWGNMYEFISAFCLMGVLAFLIVLRRQPIRAVAIYVLIPVVILMFLAGTVLYTRAASVQPSLQSYWIAIHVTAATLASGTFMVSGVSSALYLARRRAEEGGGLGALTARLPGAQLLDRVAYRAVTFGFPVWTFAIVTGAIWAESAWGRFWGWDPKETVALVAWVVYAAYLHSRSTAGWRGAKSSWVNIAGFAVMIFNLFFINLVTTGLHSYAGVG